MIYFLDGGSTFLSHRGRLIFVFCFPAELRQHWDKPTSKSNLVKKEKNKHFFVVFRKLLQCTFTAYELSYILY